MAQFPMHLCQDFANSVGMFCYTYSVNTAGRQYLPANEEVNSLPQQQRQWVYISKFVCNKEFTVKKPNPLKNLPMQHTLYWIRLSGSPSQIPFSLHDACALMHWLGIARAMRKESGHESCAVHNKKTVDEGDSVKSPLQNQFLRETWSPVSSFLPCCADLCISLFEGLCAFYSKSLQLKELALHW